MQRNPFKNYDDLARTAEFISETGIDWQNWPLGASLPRAPKVCTLGTLLLTGSHDTIEGWLLLKQ